MAQYKGKVVSATAVVDWTDIIASGALAAGESGEMVIRCNVATRVAPGVADPVASTTAGALILVKLFVSSSAPLLPLRTYGFSPLRPKSRSTLK